jgi:hypothetical protein
MFSFAGSYAIQYYTVLITSNINSLFGLCTNAYIHRGNEYCIVSINYWLLPLYPNQIYTFLSAEAKFIVPDWGGYS